MTLIVRDWENNGTICVSMCARTMPPTVFKFSIVHRREGIILSTNIQHFRLLFTCLGHIRHDANVLKNKKTIHISPVKQLFFNI